MDKRVLLALGARIRKLRKEKGFSQESFAIEAGIERSYMGSIERGESNLTFLKISRIANALDIPISELFTGL